MESTTPRTGPSAGLGPPAGAARRRVLPGWGWAVIAALATAAAVLVQTSLILGVCAATLALVAAGLTVASALGPREPEPRVTRSINPAPLGSVREAIRAGPMGREDIVFLLDRVERASVRPNLPIRRPEEVGRIVSATDEEFLRYLAARVDDLEGSM